MARNSSNERYESLMNDGETNKILHRINDYLTKNFSNLQIVRDKNNRIFKKDNDKIFILSDTNGDFYNNFTVDFDTCHKYIEDVLPIKLKHNNYVIKAIYRRFMLDNYNIDFDEFTYAKLNTNK
jgi:phosphatidate phosphatase APP1